MGIRRAAITTAMVGMFAATLGPPAAAFTTGTGALTGVASVGKWFSTPCDKNGIGRPTGRGLYSLGTVTIPGVSHGDDTREEDGVWQFSTVGTYAGAVQHPDSQDFTALTLGPFDLNICGYLAAPLPGDPDDRYDGIGAACETTKGHHGVGNIRFANGSRIKLFNVGWKASVGGTRPITGGYQEYADDAGDPRTAAKKDKRGMLAAVFQTQGGAPCSGEKQPATNNGNGAQLFIVSGTIDLLNGVVPPAKTEPKRCKGVGPEAQRDWWGKKSHDNKPDPHPCTPADGGEKENEPQ